MANVNRQRQRMVDIQIARRGIRAESVLDAMRAVPREHFVAPELAEFAYEDSPLPIGEEQTISQPSVVAAMIEAAEVGANDRMLEVGAGSGYVAALLGHIARQGRGRVFAVERHPSLAQSARCHLQDLGFGDVTVLTGDGTRGWPEEAPFDVILVSAGGPEVPKALMDQLAIGGRMVIPVGARRDQRLVKVVRRGESEFEREERDRVSFVPLIGAQGWADDGTRSADSPDFGAA